MKSILKAFSVAALAGAMALPVLAQDATPAPTTDAKDQKDLKKVIEDQGINYVETAQKGITLSGYVDTSYTEQFGGRGTGFGGGQAELHQFDTNNNNFNVNAVKIALEKALPDKNEWAAGFRVDAILGSDAKYLGDPAFGTSSSSGGTSTSTSYPIALEQALVKFRIPVGNGLDIYMGKFVTFLGYEVIESPANLNFSRGLLFTNAIPLTNTGIYADYKFNSTVEAKLAIVDGWNNSVSNPTPGGTTDSQNDYPFGGKAIMGQVNVNAPGGNANVTQSIYYAPSGDPSAVSGSVDNGPVFVYDIWGNWNPTFIKDNALTLGFNIDFGYNGATGFPNNTQVTSTSVPPVFNTAQASSGGTGVSDSNTWWGAALYASYKLNKVVTISARGEYLHEDASFNPKFGAAGVSNDDFSETLTVAFNIWDNLLTRVEYRYDHLTNGSTGVAGLSNNVATFTNQDEIAVEAVYSF
jgi:Putative beta-barrel porin-2, OmpL-like. bbp2